MPPHLAGSLTAPVCIHQPGCLSHIAGVGAGVGVDVASAAEKATATASTRNARVSDFAMRGYTSFRLRFRGTNEWKQTIKMRGDERHVRCAQGGSQRDG